MVMTLVKKNRIDFPWGMNLMSDFFDSDGFFGKDWLALNKTPRVNIEETDKFFKIELAAPGMKKDNFNVEVVNGILTISAEAKDEKEEKGKNYTRKEFNFESFTRSFTLPENVKEEKIDAEYKDGLLLLTLPKTEVKVPPKKMVEIR